jgi:hypothetical protein
VFLGYHLEVVSSRLEPLVDDVIRTLGEKEQSVVAVVQLLDDDAHSFTGAGKLEDVDKLVMFDLIREGGLKVEDIAITTTEDVSNCSSGMNKASSSGDWAL